MHKVTETLQQWRQLKQDLGLWPQHWDDLSRVMLIRRLGFVTDTQPGDRRLDDIFDGTAMQSARGLANVVGSQLRPEGEPWFFLKTADDSDSATGEAKDWLANAETTLRDDFDDPRSRFRQATGESDQDLVVLGTAMKFVGENVGKGHLTFQSIWLNDGIPVFDEFGVAEGMYRTRKLTILQVQNNVENSGWKPSEEVRKKIEEKKWDDKVQFLYVVTPRKGGREDALLNLNLPFAEMIIEPEAKHLVAESGYHEFPYIVSRWDTTSGEKYGRSPGMIALPDTNTSQAIGHTMLVAGQRAADPPLLAPSDAFVAAPNLYPGGIASYEAEAVRDLGGNPIRLLESGGNFPLTRDIQGDTREQIRMAFLRNVFNLPVEGPQMTATEVIQRREEFIREVGPVFGRLETDDTAPMVERAFKIRLRAGAFGPVPEVLSEKGVVFEYASPVKKIREMAQAMAAREWANEQAALEQIRPGSFDIVDTEALARFTGQATNVPHDIMRSTEAIEELKEQREQAQAQQAQLDQIQQAASIAKESGVVDALTAGE